MKVNVCRKGGFLIPASEEDQVNFAKIKQGEVYTFDFKKVRNYLFHRKYFAMLEIAWRNLPERYEHLWPNKNDFRYEIQSLAGIYDMRVSIEGELIKIPRSISFENMDNNEFEQVYNSVKEVILSTVLKGCDENMLMYIEAQF